MAEEIKDTVEDMLRTKGLLPRSANVRKIKVKMPDGEMVEYPIDADRGSILRDISQRRTQMKAAEEAKMPPEVTTPESMAHAMPGLIEHGSPFVGEYVGGPPGAAAGTLAGTFAARELEDFLNPPKEMDKGIADYKRVAENFKESATGAAIVGAFSFLGPPALRALSYPFRKAGAYVGRKMLLEAGVVRDGSALALQNLADKLGHFITPKEAGASVLGKMAEDIAEVAFLTRPGLGKQRAKGVELTTREVMDTALNKYVQELYKVPGGKREAGENLFALLLGAKAGTEHGQKVAKGILAAGDKSERGFMDFLISEAYKSLDDKIAKTDLKVSVKGILGLKERLKNVEPYKKVFTELEELLPKKPRTKGGKLELYDARGNVIPVVEDLGDWQQVGIKEAIEMKKRLNALLMTGGTRGEKKATRKIFGEIMERIDDALEKAPELAGALKRADALKGRIEGRWNEEIIQALIKKISRNPSASMNYILAGAVGKASGNALDRYLSLKALFTFGRKGETQLGEKVFERSIREPLQAAFLKLAAPPAKRGVLQGNILLRLFDGEGAELATELYGKETARRVVKLATLLDRYQTFKPSSSIAVQLIQGGLVVAAGSGAAWTTQDPLGFVGGAGVILLSPLLLTKVINSPRAMDAIIQGAKLGLKDRRAMARLISVLGGIQTKVSEAKAYDKLETTDQRKFHTDAFFVPEQEEPGVKQPPVEMAGEIPMM